MAHVPGAVSTRELLGHLDDLLRPSVIKDYSPNGLQVEGKAVVSRIICAVTATQNVIDAAVAEGADALLVHHGYFWKGEDPRVIGIRRRRLASLLGADINLLAYHLPLDVHPVYGNNVQLGEDGPCRAGGARSSAARASSAGMIWQKRVRWMRWPWLND